MIQYPSQEEYFSLSNANLMMDVKTYGQILENTFLYCTVAEVKHLRDKFLVLHGYADKLQLPVVALIKQVTAHLMPVKIKPLKASGEDPDVKELGNPGQTIPI